MLRLPEGAAERAGGCRCLLSLAPYPPRIELGFFFFFGLVEGGGGSCPHVIGSSSGNSELGIKLQWVDSDSLYQLLLEL